MNKTNTVNMLFVLILTFAVWPIGCGSSDEDGQRPQASHSRDSAKAGRDDPEAVAANNRGVAMMGQYKYSDAYDIFATLTEQYPGWPEVETNLAIAQLNRQSPGDETAALERLERVLLDDPTLLRAQYTAGIVAWYLGQPDRAKAHFQKVIDADPTDAFAAYYLGQCAMDAGEYQEAIDWFNRASEADPYLQSAYYAKSQAYQRVHQSDQAQEALAMFQRLNNNPRSILAEVKYTRMGPKAEAEVVDLSQHEPAPLPSGAVFQPPVTLDGGPGVDGAKWTLQPAEPGVSMTVADLNGDGRTDLFIAGARASGLDGNLVYLQQEDGSLVPGVSPLGSVDRVNAALWGDVDNNGLTDAYLLRQGPNQLWLQQSAGAFENVTDQSKTSGGDLNTVDGALFDADHDGDLDLLLVNADGPTELLNNDRDGAFRPLAESAGLNGRGRGGRQVVVADLDSDRDTDIALFYNEPPHEVFYNDLGWSYRPASGFQYVQAAEVGAAVAGDIDADGRIDLLTMNRSGNLRRWRPDEMGVWRAGGGTGPIDEVHLAPLRLALADVNGDSVTDIIGPDPSGAWRVQGGGSLEGQGQGALAHAEGPLLVGWTTAVLDSAQGPSLIGLPVEGRPILWSPGPGRFPFVTVTLSGLEDKANSMRSNASGIGARIAARIGSTWNINDILRANSGPGQGLQPLAIGLGGAPYVDFVSIDWSDGVYQTELDLASGQQHDLVETQRQLASCPVLFAYDGKQYQFVSDILGVAGLGFWIGPDKRAPSRSFEHFLLPMDLLKSDGEAYRIKIGEPMEEVCYLDAVRLVAYDLPEEYGMFLDERMGTGSPLPTGEALFYRHAQFPTSAAVRDGTDVTSLLMQADRKAVPPGGTDDRFIGLLEEPLSLTIEFGEPLDRQEGAPWLLLEGWIEYPYSQTVFAAWQAGCAYEPLSVEARDTSGQWHRLHDKIGYPAGMPRLAAIPLQGIPVGSTALRLSTTQEIYLDQIKVVWSESCESCRKNNATLMQATLLASGFPERSTGPQRVPGYDDALRKPFWDTKAQAGWYTAIGPVLPLLEGKDSAVAIIGTGEEVELYFQALEQVPVDYRRYFVLEADGWCKDMDLYTLDGDTVQPVPTLENADSDAVNALHRRFNTRYRAGR